MEMQPEKMRAVVERYMALLADMDDNNCRDIEAMLSLLTPDIEYEIPFLQSPLELHGQKVVREFFATMQGKFTEVHYDIERWLVDPQAHVVVIEMRASRKIVPHLEAYSNRYVMIFTLRDGRIANLREYLDPIRAAEMSRRLDLL